MEKNNSENFAEVMFYNKKILQEIFESKMSLSTIGEIDVIEFLTAIKSIHFIMQIITEKILTIVDLEPVEKEESAFDAYDKENGYEDEAEEKNQWTICDEIIDRIIKIAIRLLKNSYSQCMKENIVSLLNYLKFELDTVNE